MGTMSGLVAFLHAHWGKLALGAALVLLLPAGSSAFGDERLHVVANAPKRGAAMHVLVSAGSELIGTCGGEAEVEVLRQGFIMYSSSLATVDMTGCKGSIEIPYNRFASVNGPYKVKVTYDGKTATTRVDVQKVVNWVYVRSFPNKDEHRTRVDVALDAAKAKPLTSSIFATGTLVLDITWEQCKDEGIGGLPVTPPQDRCKASENNVFHAEIPVDSKASTHVIIPWENLGSDTESDNDDRPQEGYYNVTATFHNDVAKGNDNVPMDPTVYREDPPGNWFKVDYS